VFGKIWQPELNTSGIRKELSRTTTDGIPWACVAFDRDTPIGYSAIFQEDWVRPDITPWLTDVMINPDYQNKGIGKRLIELSKDHALHLGYPNIYLCTADKQIVPYYQQIGWSTFSEENHQDKNVFVLRHLL
jgi:GNAT superfamily N-acetyltransferase